VRICTRAFGWGYNACSPSSPTTTIAMATKSRPPHRAAGSASSEQMLTAMAINTRRCCCCTGVRWVEEAARGGAAPTGPAAPPQACRYQPAAPPALLPAPPGCATPHRHTHHQAIHHCHKVQHQVRVSQYMQPICLMVRRPWMAPTAAGQAPRPPRLLASLAAITGFEPTSAPQHDHPRAACDLSVSLPRPAGA
jgi:hypothetical protein